MIKDVKVQGHGNDLVKRNGSVINKDSGGYKAAKARIEKEKENQNNINKTKELENKVKSLEEKLDLILKILGDRSDD